MEHIEGILRFKYIGDGFGDMNYEVVDLLKSVTLSLNQENKPIMNFNFDYPGFHFKKELVIDFDSGCSQYDEIFLYITAVIKCKDPKTFLVLGTLAWYKDDVVENWSIIIRFRGEIPDGIQYTESP